MGNGESHISSCAGRSGRARVWLVALVALPVIVGAAIIAVRYGFHKRPSPDALPPDSTSPLARSIRLVGVQPFGADDVLDAEGKKAGEMMGIGSESPNQRLQFERTFVFEYDGTNGPLPFETAALLRPAGVARGLSTSVSASDREYGDKRRYAVRVRFDPFYFDHGIFSSFQVPIDRVDVTLRYHDGQPAPADVEFRGPFEVGTVYRDHGGGAFTLEFKPPAAGQAAPFHFVAKQTFDRGGNGWFAYDRAGKRHRLNMNGGGSWSGGGATLDYSFREPPLADIARLVCGERPQSRTFRNILVRYHGSDLSDEASPEFVRKMAAELSLTPQEVLGKTFTPEQAVRVAHLARGRNLIQRLVEPLGQAKCDSLPDDQQKRLRVTAFRWIGEGEPAVQAIGVDLGLSWSPPEFLPVAMGLLAQKGDARQDISSAVARRAKLGPHEVEQVKALLLAEPDGSIRSNLKLCLERCPLPQAKRALQEIAAAATRPSAGS